MEWNGVEWGRQGLISSYLGFLFSYCVFFPPDDKKNAGTSLGQDNLGPVPMGPLFRAYGALLGINCVYCGSILPYLGPIWAHWAQNGP